MQKLFNFMAVAAFAVTTAQVIAVSYLLNNKDKYLGQVREQVIEEVTDIIPELVQSSMTNGIEVDESIGNLNVSSPF